jgi:hypothetical protein
LFSVGSGFPLSVDRSADGLQYQTGFALAGLSLTGLILTGVGCNSFTGASPCLLLALTRHFLHAVILNMPPNSINASKGSSSRHTSFYTLFIPNLSALQYSFTVAIFVAPTLITHDFCPSQHLSSFDYNEWVLTFLYGVQVDGAQRVHRAMSPNPEKSVCCYNFLSGSPSFRINKTYSPHSVRLLYHSNNALM